MEKITIKMGKPITGTKYDFRARVKKVPLETRLYVMFWMRWLSENVGPKKRGHTEKEGEKAEAFAKKMTKETLDTIEKWKKDGSPTKRYKSKAKKKK